MSDIGVIFDMDGVLVLTEDAHWQSWLVPARKRGVELSYAAFESVFGRINPDCVPVLFGSDVSAADVAAIADEKEAAFRDIVRHCVPLAPGIEALLSGLKSLGVRCGVGSSGPKENVELILRAGGIAKYFDAVVDGSQVTRGKPAPDVFLIAAQKMGVAPANCAVIEDAPAGIRAAVAAAMLAVAVTTTHREDELREAGAAHVFRDVADLDPSGLTQLLRA